MSTPTASVAMGGTLWGDIYTSSAYLAQAGISAGDEWQLADGTTIKVLLTGGNIAINAAMIPSTGATGTNDYTALTSSATLQNVYAVNDRTATALTVASAYAFMATKTGIVTVLVAAGQTNGAKLCSTAVAGTLTTIVAGTDTQFNIELLANTGAGGATKACIY